MTNREFQTKCVKWMRSAYHELGKAGGDPGIQEIPEEVLESMIRNDIHLVYIKEDGTNLGKGRLIDTPPH